MRFAVFTLSWLAAIGSAASPVSADESHPYQLTDYSASFDGDDDDDGDGSDEFEEFEAPDPRYDWELSDGPTDINEFFAPPEYGSYFQADILWLSRSQNADRVVAQVIPANDPVLTSDDAQISNLWRPGALLTWGTRFDAVSAFEISFFGFQEWHGAATALGAGNLSIPGTLPLVTQDFIFANRIEINYDTALYNAEANYTQTIAGLTLLSGFRYFRLNENFNIESTVDALGQTSDYLVRAKSNLFGGQLGLGFDWQIFDRLTVNVLGKFGVFANVAEQNTLLRDANNTILLRNFEDNTTVVSEIGEAGVTGAFRVFDWLVVRGGYRFLWINNVALAPDQLNFSTGPGAGQSVDAKNHMFLQGFQAGAEIRW